MSPTTPNKINRAAGRPEDTESSTTVKSAGGGWENFFGYRFFLVLVLALLTGAVCYAQPAVFLADQPGGQPACTCLDNANVNQANGQFAQFVTLTDDPGLTYTVTAASNFYSSGSAAPPAAPTGLAAGTAFAEISPGVYRLEGRIVDGETAFGLTIDDGMGNTYPVTGQRCFYPAPVINGLPAQVCRTTAPIALNGSAGGVSGGGTFRVNGQPAAVFNAATLGQGTHTVTYTFDAGTAAPGDASDPGCSRTVSRTVVVPPQPDLAVIAQVNVTLNAACTVQAVPAMVLPNAYPCPEDFSIQVFNQNGQPVPGNLLTAAQAGMILPVNVMSANGNYLGSGTIFVEDESAPEITCLDDTDLANVSKPTQLINGVLNGDDPEFIPINFSCYQGAVSPVAGMHAYELREITVNQADYYTFELFFADDNGGAFGLYQDEMNTDFSLCQMLSGVGGSIPVGSGYFTNAGNRVVRYTAKLIPGMTYTLLTTSFDNDETGVFTYAVFSNAGGRVNGLPVGNADYNLPLYCGNEAQLINQSSSLAFTGVPVVADNCGLSMQPFVFTDQVVNGNNSCVPTVINRRFIASDTRGNKDTCFQQITLANIGMDAVRMPPASFVLPCDSEFATLPNGNPSPAATGYPAVVSAFGVFEINPVYCNFAGNFSDGTSVPICEGTTQFFRTWTVLDNCTNDVLTFFQVIRVGDVDDPVVECTTPDLDEDGLPDPLIYSTGAVKCTADVNVAYPTVSDNCSSFSVLTQIVTSDTTVIFNAFGNPVDTTVTDEVLGEVGNDAAVRVIPGIRAGNHRIRYIATDDCGNRTVQECPIVVRDLIAPSAVCEDALTVSLGGGGLGSITALDADQGSSDNCGDLTYAITRSIDFDPDDCSGLPAGLLPYSNRVFFYCCEVGETVTVTLRVTDPGGNSNTCTVPVSINDVSAPLCVTPPPAVVSCSTLPMNFDPTNTATLQSIFGNVSFLDGCGTLASENGFELAPVVNLSNCGSGQIIRRFQASDQFGNQSAVCQQVITLASNTNYTLTFPVDVESDCELDLTGNDLIVSNVGCDFLAISSTDQEFNLPPGGATCYKIHRTYEVINWCQYDGSADPTVISRDEDCNGISGNRVVSVIVGNTTAYVDADTNFGNNFPAAGSRGTACSTPGTGNPAGYWRQVPASGYYTYEQVIKVTNGSGPVVAIDEYEEFCTGDEADECGVAVSISLQVSDNCGAGAGGPKLFLLPSLPGGIAMNVTAANLSGNYPEFTLQATLSPGTYTYQLETADVCGNLSRTDIPVTVIDCSPPTPVVQGSLTVELTAQPPLTDVDGDGLFDPASATVNIAVMPFTRPLDCSGETTYVVYREDAIQAGTAADPAGPNLVIVTCKDLAAGVVPVRIYGFDSAANPAAVQPDGSVGGPNVGSAVLNLIVTDLDNSCSEIEPIGGGGNSNGLAQLAGHIATEQGQSVAEVRVRPSVSMSYEMMTADDGNFYFEINPGLDYDLTPTNDNEWVNGVTTFDIVLITRHILGIDEFDSPYQRIAADANGSGNISTLDILALRRLILGLNDNVAGNTSWRFVAGDYTFPDPADPWAEDFPETIPMPAFTGEYMTADFVAVKTGDVNGSATANYQDEPAAEARAGAAPFFLRTDNTAFQRGEEITVDLFPAATLALSGCQFTLQFNPDDLELIGTEAGLLNNGHLSTASAAHGILLVSFDNQGDEEIGERDRLLTLRFATRTAGKLAEVFNITSRALAAEAYAGDLSVHPLQLSFQLPESTAGTGGSEFFLEQNRPNPFGDQTIIGFHLPRAARAALTIYDTHGRVLLTLGGEYVAGYNQLLIEADRIGATGLLYYKLETEEYTATRKMVILR